MNHEKVDLKTRWSVSIVSKENLEILEKNQWNIFSMPAKKTVGKYFESKPIALFCIPENEIAILCDFKNYDDYDSLQIAVWSELDGQDDLHWFEFSVNEQNSFTYRLPLDLYETDGKYFVHVYGTKKSEQVFATGSELNINLSEIRSKMSSQLPSFEPTETSFPFFIDSEDLADGTLSLSGWAYNGNDDCDVYIGVADKTFKAQMVHRPDVKEAFGLENDTQGFSATIPLESDLQNYTLYLVNNSKKEIYKKTISISKSDDLDEVFSNAVDIE